MSNNPQRVSVHGGHSGQFCNHAVDSLEDIVQAYIGCGYTWVGITEHIPPVSDDFLYPDEVEAGLSSEIMHERFAKYVQEGRRLQRKYKDQIELYVAMEIETYSGYQQHVERLIKKIQPDYIVGSIHHVDDIPIDYSHEFYEQAISESGGIDHLYCRFFDQQYEMLQSFKPAVVGHIDLIRIFDSDYHNRLKVPVIWDRIVRNLEFVKKYDLILDYNIRSLIKGGKEPYVTTAILELALEMGVAVVPGDDSHGIDSIGVNIDGAMANLRKMGFKTNWQKPRLY